MRSPACNHPKMEEKLCDETLSYGDQSVTLHGMRGMFCPVYGEGVWDSESYQRYTEAQTTLIRSVKGDVTSP